MQLSVRTINTLEENGIIMCRDLLPQTWESLMEMKNFGERTFTEVSDAVVALGLEKPNWQPVKQPRVKPKRARKGKHVRKRK
jgi:DNA-directed RNA polymerase alpha subunit